MDVIPEENRPRSRQVISRTERDGSALEASIGIMRRQLPVVLFMIVVGVAGAGLYLLTAPPLFTASADVLTEAFRPAAGKESAAEDEDTLSSVETHIATIMSERIARKVVKDLSLAHDPEFYRPSEGLANRIIAAFRSPEMPSPAPTEDQRLRAATDSFRERLAAHRIGTSYVVRISFTSRFPEEAARIANEVAEAYISDRLDAKFEATQRTRAWLKTRVAELSRETEAAEKAVLDFRLAHKLAVDNPRIDDLDRQLSEAKARMSAAEDRLGRITQMIESGIEDMAHGEFVSNAPVAELRQRYLDVSARANDWAGRYGEEHEAVQTLRAQTKSAFQSLLDEIKRTQQAYRNEYELARSQWEDASRSLEQELDRSSPARHALVRLRELEAAAHQSRMLYDEFVERELQAAQQPSIPSTEARVLTNAVPPATMSYPIPAVVVGWGLIAGLAAGLGIGILRERLNTTLRTRQQLETASGLPCLALLPRIETGKIRVRQESGGREREVAPTRREWNAVLQSPFSPFGEGMRAIKLAADLHLAGEGGVVLGIVSALPGEGRSTVAANLAFHMAQNGDRVLLIDCDMRRGVLSTGLARHSAEGLSEVLDQAEVDLDSLIWTHPESGLNFLPAGGTRVSTENSGTRLGSPTMERLLRAARSRYDYIVLDCAPLLPVIDVRAAANRVDGFVLVAAWNETPFAAVSEAVSLSATVRTRLLGAVMNKVEMRTLRRYGEADGP